jgi:hypothetical protein
MTGQTSAATPRLPQGPRHAPDRPETTTRNLR